MKNMRVGDVVVRAYDSKHGYETGIIVSGKYWGDMQNNLMFDKDDPLVRRMPNHAAFDVLWASGNITNEMDMELELVNETAR